MLRPTDKLAQDTKNYTLPAKLLRIVWALLTYKEEFNIHKAGVPRSVLAAIERPQESTVAAEAAA